jgi:hypothetical protein
MTEFGIARMLEGTDGRRRRRMDGDAPEEVLKDRSPGL